MAPEHSPAEVFGLLSDETRVDILRAVAVAQSDARSGGAPALSFSEVYDEVDVDNTSKLSYHLGELTGTFLRKDDDGYSFTHAGEQTVRFVLAENYESPRDFGPIPVDGDCPFCGDTDLQARPNHQFLLVECCECERPVTGYEIPPAQARSRDGEELVESIKQRFSSHYRLVRQGVCPKCSGRLSTTVEAIEETPLADIEGYVVTDRCEACLRTYNTPLPYSVAYHPASVAFHWDHGVDITSMGMWEFHRHRREGRWTGEQRSTDPETYEVVLRHGEDALRARLDDTATVTRTERVRRAGPSDHE